MKNLYTSIALMAATSIGAAILFFPTLLIPTGFILSLILLLLAWAVMNYTGFLFLEVTLWFPPGSHFITMGQKLLGRPITIMNWLIYLLLTYLLLSAYLMSFVTLLTNVLSYFGDSLQYVRYILFLGVLLIACLLYFFRPIIQYFIVALVLLLFIFLVIFFGFSVPHLHSKLLVEHHEHLILTAISLVLIAFGYHFIIPKVRDGIDGEQFKNARRIIFFTGLLLLAIYLLWLIVIFGVLPVLNKYGFMHYLHTPPFTTSINHSFQWTAGRSWVLLGHVIFLCALCTSFLKITNSLYNVTAKIFNVTNNAGSKLLLLVFIFLPPLVYISFFSHALIFALTIVGILISYLYIITPAVMCWIGRHAKQTSFGYRVKGGRLVLAGVILVGLVLMALQIYSLFI
jgi:tyrosine-specific transport protein